MMRRILSGVAAASAAGTLLLAALDLLALAGCLLAAAIGFLALRLVFFLYDRLPEADRTALFSRRFLRRAILASTILAVVVSCTYWYAAWYLPLDSLPLAMRSFLLKHWSKGDFVPALFAQLLPSSWESGFHHYFDDGMTYCFPGSYWWESMRFLRAAIPGYFVAFFAAILLLRLGAASVHRLRGAGAE